jgi:hypothetical protein
VVDRPPLRDGDTPVAAAASAPIPSAEESESLDAQPEIASEEPRVEHRIEVPEGRDPEGTANQHVRAPMPRFLGGGESVLRADSAPAPNPVNLEPTPVEPVQTAAPSAPSTEPGVLSEPKIKQLVGDILGVGSTPVDQIEAVGRVAGDTIRTNSQTALDLVGGSRQSH